MANTTLTQQVLVREALAVLHNSNNFIKAVGRKYQDEFATANVKGQKVGSTIGIRYPNQHITRSGPTAVPQSTVETQQTLVVAQQKGVDMSFSTVEMTMNIVDFSERYIVPAVNNLVASVASDVISGAVGIPNVVHNVDGSNNTITPTFGTFARANAMLDNQSVPRGRGKRIAMVDPITMGNAVTSFAGLFNNQSKVGEQYSTGMVTDNVIGMDWMMDQTVPKQVTGAYAATTVNGAGQSGATLTVTATTGPINAGDIFTLPGVYAVNRVNYQSNGQLRQFTVNGPAGTVYPAGTTSLPIYPSINPALTTLNAQGNYQVAKQNVTTSPANGAALVFIFNAGETYRKNFVFHPDAVTLACVPLDVPTGPGVMRSATETQDGISLSLVTYYDGTNFQEVTRLDILYGYKWLRPDWAAIIADAL